MTSSVIPVIVAARIRRYKNAFRKVHATTPATAVSLAEVGLRASVIFKRLVQQGILVAVDKSRFYLDEARDEVVTRGKRKVVALFLFIVLALLISGAIAAWKK